MICNALDVNALEDSSDLHLRPFWAHVEIKAERNEISFYEKRERTSLSPRPSGNSSLVGAPPPARKPWERS
jgi:hypothetical protein